VYNCIVKTETTGINDADFGEVQLTIRDTVLTEKGITDKGRVCETPATYETDKPLILPRMSRSAMLF
jgi:hypothetical protein